MAEFLDNHLVTILVCIVVLIYITAYRVLAPRKSTPRSTNDTDFQTDYYDQVVNCDPYSDHRWVPAPDQDVPTGAMMAFNGTCAADFSIRHRETFPFDKAPNLADGSIETTEDRALSYTELAKRANLPYTLPVSYTMLELQVLTMLTNTDSTGRFEALMQWLQAHGVTRLRDLPESQYLLAWSDFKTIEATLP